MINPSSAICVLKHRYKCVVWEKAGSKKMTYSLDALVAWLILKQVLLNATV